MKIILIINAGSSSIKFEVMNKDDLNILANGLLERLYVDGAYSVKYNDKKIVGNEDFPNHEVAIKFLIKKLVELKIIKKIEDIVGIGHRVVHGGNKYRKACIVGDVELQQIEKLSVLAPLHNPGAVAGIKAFRNIAPSALNVAQFDTAFHATIPDYNYTIAIPEYWRKDLHVRRYGMHGISFEYITQKAAKVLNKEKPNLIIAHLGNGASIAAIKEGKSYNTSMSFTPLAGLVMGTRTGDIDAGILEYIAKQTGKNISEINVILNKESGLKGLTGYADMREIEAQANNGNADAKLAFKIWARRIARYIVDYFNQLNGNIDALIFTAGIGENSPYCRNLVIRELKTMVIKLNSEKNNSKYNDVLEISDEASPIKTFVIRTNEEKMIAKKLLYFLK